ncbi:paraneoplastic antigen Ma2 [Carassius auratus]|uniref:Paraneoplastic antigen Ma2 n=1 Tax=Carassius auratus TaxID=7957 RepID=A0A6P6PRX5_CARAU|nr:paraneoplastic antigen Ma2-like [Carassius auratus]
MALTKDPFLQAELAKWCKDAGIDETHALMLLNVPVHTEVAEIEEAMEAVKALGRVRVRDTREGPTSRSLLVLCECKQAIDPKRIPTDVSWGEKNEPWSVIVIQTQESASDAATGGFTEKLAKFLMEEGKSLSDIQALISPHSAPDSSPESIIRAMGEVFAKTVKLPSDSNAYRRLRTLSAAVPTPVGEENMETWMDQARLMITECDCSEKEKRRRIVESLKGPALDIIRAVRFSDPEASALQYLEALESTFGSSESGEDLYFKFRLMRQGTGEALSEFLRRMEKTLSKVVEREGLSLRLVDKRPTPSQSASTSLRYKTRDDYFCYRCGDDGHIATKCQAPPNSDQVIQKLIRSLRQAKSGKNEMGEDRTASNQACFSKKSQTDIYNSSRLPKGLVGPASTVEVKLNGCGCQALLDSGSQVTIVFDSWYSRNLVLK